MTIMEGRENLFERFGGTREMARKLGVAPSTVQRWKTARRIASKAQDLVLERGRLHSIDVSAEDVVWPFPEDREAR